jgi:uncharacterized lipoprotein YmbA
MKPSHPLGHCLSACAAPANNEPTQKEFRKQTAKWDICRYLCHRQGEGPKARLSSNSSRFGLSCVVQPPKLRSAALLCVLALSPTGCATRSEPVEFFALDAIASPAAPRHAVGRQLAIAVGPAMFPEYLDRPQIVTRTAANRLNVDEFHRWGGSLQEEFLRVLGENLGTMLGTSHVLVYPAEARGGVDFQILVDVLRFEGVGEREVLLKVRWALVDPDTEETVLIREALIRDQAQSPETAHRVAAQSRALGALSRQIAEQLQVVRRDR